MSCYADNPREKIIDVAEQVALENGARHLSLDVVASKSGISRSGLVQHFSNKEALLRAVLDRRVKRAMARREQNSESLRENQKTLIDAHIPNSEEGQNETKRTHVGLLATIEGNTQSPEPYREDFKKGLHELCLSGLSVERAAVILLAIEGTKLLELLSLLTFTPQDRRRIIREIMSLAKGEP